MCCECERGLSVDVRVCDCVLAHFMQMNFVAISQLRSMEQNYETTRYVVQGHMWLRIDGVNTLYAHSHKRQHNIYILYNRENRYAFTS